MLEVRDRIEASSDDPDLDDASMLAALPSRVPRLLEQNSDAARSPPSRRDARAPRLCITSALATSDGGSRAASTFLVHAFDEVKSGFSRFLANIG